MTKESFHCLKIKMSLKFNYWFLVISLFLTTVANCFQKNKNYDNEDNSKEYNEFMKQYENWSVEISPNDDVKIKVIRHNNTENDGGNPETGYKYADTGLTIIDKCTDSNGISYNCDLRVSHCDVMLNKCVACSLDCPVREMKRFPKRKLFCENECPVYLITEAEKAKLRGQILMEIHSGTNQAAASFLNVLKEYQATIWTCLVLAAILSVLLLNTLLLVRNSLKKTRNTDCVSDEPLIQPGKENENIPVGDNVEKCSDPVNATSSIDSVGACPEQSAVLEYDKTKKTNPVVRTHTQLNHSVGYGQRSSHVILPTAGQSRHDIRSVGKEQPSPTIQRPVSWPKCAENQPNTSQAGRKNNTNATNSEERVTSLGCHSNADETRPLLESDLENSALSLQNK